MIADAMGIYTLWLRDLKRFLRERSRIAGTLAQPALFLLLLGTGLGVGLGGSLPSPWDAYDYLMFIYPGILGMTLLFTSVLSAISIVWDREVGFLKVVMVAPVRRWAVVIGKTVGGSTVAFLQGLVMLLLAPVVGLRLTPFQIVQLLPAMFLIGLVLTVMGIAVASRMRSMQGFTVVMNFILLPMFFLSGAMFPTEGLPDWMTLLVVINPLTYGVDLLRTILLRVPHPFFGTDLLVLIGFGLVILTMAVRGFREKE
jgi:ABC-2 type transport system permease protein